MNQKQKEKRARAERYKKRKLNSKMRQKLVGLFIIVMLALVGLAIRITVINASQGEQYKKNVLSQSQQQYSDRTIPFKRGDILDANKTVLATSEKVYNMILDCKVCNSKESYADPTVAALVQVFGADEPTLRTLLFAEQTKNSQYQILARGLTTDQKNAWEAYVNGTEDNPLTEEEKTARSQINGVWFEEAYRRTYPYSSLACDLIGFTNANNSSDWGLEGYYNTTLNGVDGRKYGYFNDDEDVEQTIISPKNGQSIVSTIDVNIQQTVEKYINQFNSEMSAGPFGNKGAQNVGVIVMRPTTGEILAMASNNAYDLNNPRDLSPFYSAEEIAAMSDEQTAQALNALWNNFCIGQVYEPGSTVKPLSVGAALESGTLTGDESFYCDGYQIVAGTRIKCDDVSGHGEETLSDVIRNSCNDGMMQIAEKMGVDTFCDFQRIYNFGSKTGIDLSGEESGILYSKDTMGAVDLAINAFGQGFTCTMIQEASAISGLINGGYYYKPHVISQVLDERGSVVKNIEPTLVRQTVSTDVSAMIRQYMKASVDDGTSKYAKVDGYSSGGKTGTAQKIPRGNGKYLVSYVGFTTVDDPQVLIYVVVDEPNTDNQANSRYAQAISKNIMTEVLPYMNIYPDEAVSDSDTSSESVSDEEGDTDGIADTNVPEPVEEDTAETEPDTEGITNEDAGLE